jgi:hypothetical protein
MIGRDLLRGGVSVMLVVAIMVLGSFGLWVGTPLGWLWIGSQVQGRTDSLGAALVTMFVGVLVSIWLMAVLLSRMSDLYRTMCLARGRRDPGHFMLESVLVVSAGITIVCFGIWFFFLAGASPVPIGPTV